MQTSEDGHPARDVKRGDHVEYRDVNDKWHRGVAASAIEGTHENGRKIHDFPVVWVVGTALRRMPWPAEDVRPAPPGVPDDFTAITEMMEALRDR